MPRKRKQGKKFSDQPSQKKQKGDLPVNENKYIQKVRQPSENETLDRFRQWFVARKAKNEKKPTAHQIMADFAVLVVRHKSTLNSCQLSNFGFLNQVDIDFALSAVKHAESHPLVLADVQRFLDGDIEEKSPLYELYNKCKIGPELLADAWFVFLVCDFADGSKENKSADDLQKLLFVLSPMPFGILHKLSPLERKIIQRFDEAVQTTSICMFCGKSFLTMNGKTFSSCDHSEDLLPFSNLFLSNKPDQLCHVKPFYQLCVLGFVRYNNTFHSLPKELSDPDFYSVNTDPALIMKMLNDKEVNQCWNALLATYGPTETACKIYELVHE